MTMKRSLIVFVCLGTALLLAQSGTPPQNAFTPDQIKWSAAPPSLSPGAQLAVLEGDPGASSGDFTVRLKTPDGYKVAPHWHPKREEVTVISGTFKVGMGDKWDDSKLMSLPTTAWLQERP